jgi:hypothetical protein
MHEAGGDEFQAGMITPNMIAAKIYYIFGTMEPTSLVPSGFSISIHHLVPAGSGDGAEAWMS